MKLFSFFLVLFVALGAVLCDDCTGSQNNLPILQGPLKFVKSAKNGKLYSAPGTSPELHVLHVFGTPYEMGYAQGELLKDQIQTMVGLVEDYMYNQVGQYINWMPEWAQKLVEEGGVELAFEAEVLATGPYTNVRFTDEIRGIADGAGISFSRLNHINLLPELIKAACSMYGAWGDAIIKTNGTLYQLRALDWTTNGPFQLQPLINVYHPSAPNSNIFATVGWVGFVGAISGYSNAKLGLCEKVWLSYEGRDTRFGTPFHFVLRDILQFAKDKNGAVNQIVNADRTCSVYVGLGDDKSNTFQAVLYSYQNVTVWDQYTMPSWQGHPALKDLVYIDKHKQPSHDPCLGDLLTKYYGAIDVDNTIRKITPVFQTGDMHIAVYDFAQNMMYVSNAGPSQNGQNGQPAYDRQFFRLNMTQLFSESL